MSLISNNVPDKEVDIFYVDILCSKVSKRDIQNNPLNFTRTLLPVVELSTKMIAVHVL